MGGSHQHQSYVDICEIDFAQWIRNQVLKPLFVLDFLRLAITGYVHDLIRRAQPTFARVDGYVMLVQFLILMRKYENRCTYVQLGTRLGAIAPGETATTRIYRADHAELTCLKILKTGCALSAFNLSFLG